MYHLLKAVEGQNIDNYYKVRKQYDFCKLLLNCTYITGNESFVHYLTQLVDQLSLIFMDDETKHQCLFCNTIGGAIILNAGFCNK